MNLTHSVVTSWLITGPTGPARPWVLLEADCPVEGGDSQRRDLACDVHADNVNFAGWNSLRWSPP